MTMMTSCVLLINAQQVSFYLSYYYGVVGCDSSATADHLYKGYDRLEFERSSNVLDLRFIPDMEFKHPSRDVATEAPKDYVGLDFHTRALQHSKVHLTWDEDEPQRSKALKQKFNADRLDELDFQQFLASNESESDEDENENENIKKSIGEKIYRDKEDEDLDMGVFFNTGKGERKKLARKNISKYSSDDDSSDTDQEPPAEQPDDFIEEPSIKKKGASDKKDRKEKHQQETDREGKGKKDKKAPDEDKIPTADFDDPRFSALFTSPLFALDPIDPQFKRCLRFKFDISDFIAQQQQRGDHDVPLDNGEKKFPGATQLQSNDPEVNGDGILGSDVPKETKHEISSLVRSTKMKSNQVQASPKAKMPKKNEKFQVNLAEKEENRKLSTMVKSVKKKARKIRGSEFPVSARGNCDLSISFGKLLDIHLLRSPIDHNHNAGNWQHPYRQ
ncbi:hypothetical protein RJ641_010859 [Dillenia turbinata]|uniref:NUC153 domain-containing protein n=1 Tax=Dillenia turbinata TaxID=194707 RepID=A0AAN8UV35_9MAGN